MTQTAKKPSNEKQYPAGVDLFQKGDPGGDLFYIAEGEVEIYTSHGYDEIVLTVMKKGELIGVMTCLTTEQRMASARAKTDVVCKIIPHSHIQKTLKSLPNWMKIVLKEFTVRLNEVNNLYSSSVGKIKKLKKGQITRVYTAAQLAAGFATFGEYVGRQVDDYKVIEIDPMLDKLEMGLNVSRSTLDRIFAVLLEAGLVKVQIDPDKNLKVVTEANAKKLAFFAQFVNEAERGKNKKLVRARFANKETRTISAVVKYVAKLGAAMNKTCTMPVKDLQTNLKKAMGVKFELEAFDKAIKHKLVQVKGEKDDMTLHFNPTVLGRTIACIEAVRKLNALDEAELANLDGDMAA